MIYRRISIYVHANEYAFRTRFVSLGTRAHIARERLSKLTSYRTESHKIIACWTVQKRLYRWLWTVDGVSFLKHHNPPRHLFTDLVYSRFTKLFPTRTRLNITNYYDMHWALIFRQQYKTLYESGQSQKGRLVLI